MVPKTYVGICPILDLKSLNKFLYFPKFCMESARPTISSLRQGGYLTSVDIQDAYLCILTYPVHQQFLHFAIGHFHLCEHSDPWAFTKVLAPLLKNLGHSGHRVPRWPSLERLSLKTICKCPNNYPDSWGLQLGNQLSKVCSSAFPSPRICIPNSGNGRSKRFSSSN